ncbi:MAG: hypothetical protein V1798_12405 [Pseudomonadota bacterium]
MIRYDPMSMVTSVVLTLVIGTGILVLAVREIRKYREDQRHRTELYPYTPRRLIFRLAISACLLVETVLLLPLSHTLTAARPAWFTVYVILVTGIAVAMFVLAWLDFRESVHLQILSQKRLLQEFIEDLKRGPKTPGVH